jgi:hypothetical protein
VIRPGHTLKSTRSLTHTHVSVLQVPQKYKIAHSYSCVCPTGGLVFWSSHELDFVPYVGSYSQINYFVCTQIGNHCHNTNSANKGGNAITSIHYSYSTTGPKFLPIKPLLGSFLAIDIKQLLPAAIFISKLESIDIAGGLSVQKASSSLHSSCMAIFFNKPQRNFLVTTKYLCSSVIKSAKIQFGKEMVNYLRFPVPSCNTLTSCCLLNSTRVQMLAGHCLTTIFVGIIWNIIV